MSIKTIINKNGNKIFRKKIFQLSLIILLIISIEYIINGLFERQVTYFFIYM